MINLKHFIFSAAFAGIAWLIIQYSNIEVAIIFLAALLGYSVSLNKDFHKNMAGQTVQIPDKSDASPVVPQDNKTRQSYSVMIIDNLHKDDPSSRIDKVGFKSKEQAFEYGMRRVRSSVKQCRNDGQSKEKNYHMWMALGEEVTVEGVSLGSVHYDEFYEHDPSVKECDYLSLDPEQGIKT